MTDTQFLSRYLTEIILAKLRPLLVSVFFCIDFLVILSCVLMHCGCYMRS